MSNNDNIISTTTRTLCSSFNATCRYDDILSQLLNHPYLLPSSTSIDCLFKNLLAKFHFHNLMDFHDHLYTNVIFLKTLKKNKSYDNVLFILISLAIAPTSQHNYDNLKFIEKNNQEYNVQSCENKDEMNTFLKALQDDNEQDNFLQEWKKEEWSNESEPESETDDKSDIHDEDEDVISKAPLIPSSSYMDKWQTSQMHLLQHHTRNEQKIKHESNNMNLQNTSSYTWNIQEAYGDHITSVIGSHFTNSKIIILSEYSVIKMILEMISNASSLLFIKNTITNEFEISNKISVTLEHVTSHTLITILTWFLPIGNNFQSLQDHLQLLVQGNGPYHEYYCLVLQGIGVGIQEIVDEIWTSLQKFEDKLYAPSTTDKMMTLIRLQIEMNAIKELLTTLLYFIQNELLPQRKNKHICISKCEFAGRLLSILYKKRQVSRFYYTEQEDLGIWTRLFTAAVTPYHGMLKEWMKSGSVVDPFSELYFTTKNEKTKMKIENESCNINSEVHLMTKMVPLDIQTNAIPTFLRKDANKILCTGIAAHVSHQLTSSSHAHIHPSFVSLFNIDLEYTTAQDQLLSLFHKNLKLEFHLNALLDLYLCRNYAPLSLFRKSLFDCINSTCTIQRWMNTSQLNSVLYQSLQFENIEYADRFSVVLNIKKAREQSTLEGLSFHYDINYSSPLNAILSLDIMEKYNTIGRMLLHIQHIEYTVVQAAHTLKKHHHVEYYHEMHLHISKMIHFTQHVREYFFYHIKNCSSIFISSVQNNNNSCDRLIQVVEAHEKMLFDIFYFCFLNTKQKTIFTYLQTTLQHILHCIQQIFNMNTQDVVVNMKKAFECADHFHKAYRNIVIILKAMVETGSALHLESLLVRLG